MLLAAKTRDGAVYKVMIDCSVTRNGELVHVASSRTEAIQWIDAREKGRLIYCAGGNGVPVLR